MDRTINLNMVITIKNYLNAFLFYKLKQKKKSATLKTFEYAKWILAIVFIFHSTEHFETIWFLITASHYWERLAYVIMNIKMRHVQVPWIQSCNLQRANCNLQNMYYSHKVQENENNRPLNLPYMSTRSYIAVCIESYIA